MNKTLVLAAMMFGLMASNSSSAELDPDLVQALSRGDWVAASGPVRNAVPTLISAYASLPTGDHAAATTAFSKVSAVSPQDLRDALDAANSFTSRQPHSWAGHLLQADLLARGKDCDRALVATSRPAEPSGVFPTFGLLCVQTKEVVP